MKFVGTSIANLAVLIGTDAATRLVHSEAEFADMSALLFSDYQRLTPEHAIAASRRVVGLLHAFLRQFGNDYRDSKLEAELRSHMARRLIEIINCRTDQTIHLAQLGLEACRLHWPQVFKWQSLRAFLKLMKRQFVGIRSAVHG